MDITDMTLKFCVGYQIASSQKSRTHYNPVPSAAWTPPQLRNGSLSNYLLLVVELREARGKDAARTASRTVRAAEPDYDSKGLIKHFHRIQRSIGKRLCSSLTFAQNCAASLPCCDLL